MQAGTLVLADLAQGNSSQTDRAQGSIIDQKYQVLGLLGKGGMGAVYLARHLMLDKEMALKTFSSANLTEEARLRFQREAQAIGKYFSRLQSGSTSLRPRYHCSGSSKY